MPLAAGTRIGPYEILAPLGAGGMGEVYRATDSRLHREVAVKILPAAFAGDRDRLRRFEQEALATAALNHPNILAVYDVGTHEAAPFVVSELLEGESLRKRLNTEPLPVRKALDYAVQLARGLAAAHDKGIVHRDLKPENLFITRDGRLKILDFGLAKLKAVESPLLGQTAVETVPVDTEPGTILGTVGYMAPEQVRAQPADHRADIFAFGAILYEMLSGQRAFGRDSNVETLSAILKEDPAPIGRHDASIPPAVERIVTHCLEKNPDDRFQSARDLAFDLGALSDPSIATTTVPSAARTKRRWTHLAWGAAVIVALIAASAAGMWVATRRSTAPAPPTFEQLTFRHGSISAARFAPDGHTVIYAAAWDGTVPEIYSTRPGTAESRPFGLERADLLAISTSGDLAVSLNRRFQGAFTFTGVAARVPLAGGAPREILENVQYADWAPDGQSLLIVRELGGRTRLEFPAGKVLYETAGWLSHPRVSPRGDVVAFIDHPIRGDDAGSVSVVTSTGTVKRLSTTWLSVQGLAWSGDQVWFTATATGGARALFAVTLDGALRPIVRVAGGLTIQDVFPDGRVLVTRDSSRIGIAALDSGETRERDLSWLDWSLARALGRDGRTVLFDETAEGGGPRHGVYVRKMDGSPAVRLGDGIAQDLSPDGKWAASFPSDRNEIVLLPTGPGEPKKVAVKNIALQAVRFFPDGKTLLIAGNEPGHAVRLYAQAIDGGEARPLSPEGITVNSIAIPPDGRHVLGRAADQQYYLFPVSTGEPIVVKGLSSEDAIAGFNPSGASVFIFERAHVPSAVYEVPLDGGPRRLITRIDAVAASPQIGIQGLKFTADLKGYVYSYFRTDAELYLVEGLK